jgi:hypothetical protein
LEGKLILAVKSIVFWNVTPCSPVDVYGVTFQKTALLITTAVRTSNSTCIGLIVH